MRRIGCVCVVVVSLFVPRAALAQDNQLPVASSQLPVVSSPLRVASSRPHALLPLEVTFAAAQALDYVTTTRALSSGAGREANPLMGGIVGNRPAFIAIKAASTAGILLVSEKLWKKNRVGAVVMMVIADGVMGAVVAHNARVK